MHNQLNSLKEMVRRVAFLFYIGLGLTYCIACVVLLARPGWGELAVTMLAFAATAGFRWIGYQYLDFSRVFESFPAGCLRDLVPEPVRVEVERLVAEFIDAETDWKRRVEIRHSLLELEEQEPTIVEAYAAELRQVLPA